MTTATMHSGFEPAAQATPSEVSHEADVTAGTFDKALTMLVNTTLVLSIGLALFMMMTMPGQPLDFLVSSSCLSGS